MELPAADAGVEDRPGAGHRQHGGAEARRDDPAVRAVLRGRSAARPACRKGVVNILTGLRRRGRRARRAPGRRQGRLHRLHRGRQGDRARRSPAPARRSRSSWAARRANIVFDDAPIDQAVEGIVNGIFFNQGHVCCAGLPAARPGVGRRTRCWTRSSAGCRTLRLGDPLDKNTDIGAINSAEQLARITALAERRRGRGRRALVPRLRTARLGLLVRRRRCSPASPRRTASPARRSSARCCRC